MRALSKRLFDFWWGHGHRRRRPCARVLPRPLARPVRAGRRRAPGAAARGRRLGPRRSPTQLNRFLPEELHRDVQQLVVGTRDNSPLLLALAVVAMLWTSSGAIGVIERCESRILELPAPRRRHRAHAQHGARRARRVRVRRRHRQRAGDRRGRASARPHAGSSRAACIARPQRARLGRDVRGDLPLRAALADRLAARFARRDPRRTRDPGHPVRSSACTSARPRASRPCGCSCCSPSCSSACTSWRTLMLIGAGIASRAEAKYRERTGRLARERAPGTPTALVHRTTPVTPLPPSGEAPAGRPRRTATAR